MFSHIKVNNMSNKLFALAMTGLATASGTTVFSTLSIVSTPLTPSANALSSDQYPRHAHPFRRIGSNYSQSSGDAQCRKIFKKDTAPFTDPTGLGLDAVAKKLYSPKLYSYDGVEINSASHVWYHQVNGECVANIGRF
jgi:hypothetical protein